MMTAKEAREQSKYECENLPVDVLIEDINKYIKLACCKKEIEMNYMVDGTKYTAKTARKAIKLLKRNGYIVKIVDITVVRINNPIHVKINIRWW